MRIRLRIVSSVGHRQCCFALHKFTSFAFPLRPLLAELELRASENAAELGSLLDECHAAWISIRKGLIVPRVEREIKRMEPTTADIVDLVSLTSGGLCIFHAQRPLRRTDPSRLWLSQECVFRRIHPV